MPDITGFAPKVYTSTSDLKARQAAIDEEDKKRAAALDWYDIYSAAAVNSSFVGPIIFDSALPAGRYDPNYRLDQAELDRLSQDIDPALRFGFAAARSAEHAQILRSKYLTMTRDSQALHDAGWVGTVSSLTASILDPAALTAGLLTGGAGTAAGVVTKAGRLAQLAKAGFAAGGTFAGLEAARASVDPRVKTSDILRAGASGFGFGAGAVATRGSGFVARALAQGGGGAAGSLAVDLPASVFDRDVGAKQVLWNAGTQLAFGGVASALHSTKNPALDTAARNMLKDTEWADIAAVAKARGVEPTTLLDDAGKAYFKDQIDTAGRLARELDRVSPIADEVAEGLQTPPEAAEPPAPLVGRDLRAKRRLEAVREAQKVVDDARWDPARRGELEKALQDTYGLGVGQSERIVASAVKERRPRTFTEPEAPATVAAGAGDQVHGGTLDSEAAIDAIVRDATALAESASLPHPAEQAEPQAVKSTGFAQSVDPRLIDQVQAEHGDSATPAPRPSKGGSLPAKFAADKPFGSSLGIPETAAARVEQLTASQAERGGFVPDEALNDGPMSWYDANYLAIEAGKENARYVYGMQLVDKAADTWAVVRRPRTDAELVAERGDQARVYSRAEIERRLSDHYADTGYELSTDAEVESAGVGQNAFKFYKTLPGEVKAMIESDPSLRRLFTVTESPSGAGGWDALHDMGADAYMRAAQRYGNASIKRALEAAHNSIDPEMRFLAALYDNLPAKADRVPQVSMTPSELPPGSTFTIHGEKFRVEVDGSGDWTYRVLRDDRSYPETPLDALSKIPVDRDSLTTPGGGSRPAVDKKIADWADAGIADSMAQLRKAIPRGDNVGATTLPSDIFQTARIVVFSVIKAGAKTVSAIRTAVNKFIDSAGIRKIESEAAKARAAADRVISDAIRDGVLPYQDKGVPDAKNTVQRPVGDLDLSDVRNMPKSAFGAQLKAGDTVLLTARFDMAGHVGQSPSQAVRDIGAMVLPDPIPRGDRATVTDANTWADNRSNGFVGQYLGRNDVAWAAHMKEAAAKGKQPMGRGDLMEEAGKAVRRAPGEYTTDPNVNAAAENTRNLFRGILELAKRHNVKGFENIGPDDLYLTRIGSRAKIDAVEAKIGHDGVIALIKEAYTAKNQWATGDKEGVATNIAKAWVKNIGRTVEPDAMATLELQDPTLIAGKVREILGDAISEQDVRAIGHALGRDPADIGKMSEAKQRIVLDETYGREFFDEQGNSIGRFSVEDLLENNAEVISALYTRRVIGQAAVSEVFQQLSRITGKEINSIVAAKRVLKEEAQQVKGYSEKAIDRDIEKIEIGLKLAAGMPLSETTATVRAVRAIRNLNYIRLMSHPATGIRNAFEVVGSMAELGPDVLTHRLPDVKALFDRAANGDLSDRALREMAFLAGIGEGWSARRPLPHFADDLAGTTSAEQLIAKGTRFVSAAALTAPAQTTIERAVAKSVLQTWSEIAFANKRPGKLRRLGLGIQSEAQLDAIAEQIRRYAKVDADSGRMQIIEPNFESWKDQDAARLCLNAVQKQTFRLIQQNSPASYAKWMTTETGKAIAQLRTFTFGAWTNKTLYNIRMADSAAFIQWALSSVGAGASFVVGAYLRSIGRADSEKYLRNNLAPDKLIKASFAQAAYSSLIPTAIDTAAPIFGQDEVFSFARTTQLSNNVILGNPTLDWFESAWRGKNAILGPFSPNYSLSQDDVKALQNGLWVPRVIGVQGVIDQLARRLPKHSTKPKRED